MASPTLEYLRSPFENVFQILPQGHDKALKQAFYNTGATLFVVFVCGAAVAVYYILEAFLRPLLWAVLCGTFLHPFKNTLTSILRSWLKGLRTSGTPFAIGTVLLPLQVLDSTSETVGNFVWEHSKLILAACCFLPVTYLLYYFGPLQQIWSTFVAIFYFVYEALGYFSAIWVWTLVIGYVLVVIFYWTPKSSAVLKAMALPVWVALLFHLATIAGPLRVPIVIATVVLVIVGFSAEINEARKNKKNEEGSAESSSAWTAVWRIWSSSNKASAEPASADTSLNESSELPTTEDKAEKEPGPTRTESESSGSKPGQASKPRPQGLNISRTRPPERSSSGPLPGQPQQPLSNRCLIGLVWAIIIVRLWINLWIIQLIPLLIIILIFKKIGARLDVVNRFQKLRTNVYDKMSNDTRFEILAPKPVRGLAKLVARGDRKIVSMMESSLDKTVSVLIILLLLMGAVLATFLTAVQVHQESMHLVTVSSNLVNKSLSNSQWQWLPDGEEMQKALDSMVGNAYVYGRQWIADKVHSMLNVDDDKKSHVEKQVLEVWDQLYRNWFARACSDGLSLLLGTCSQNNTRVIRPQSNLALPDFTNLSSIWDVMKVADDFNLDIVEFFQENIHIVMSVLESVWTVLKGNVNLMMNVLTATLSLVFGGGTALLNLLLAFVVFITTLFYLLASSGDQYKPVEWFVSISPTGGGSSNKFGTAVEEAIGSVFMASLKMAAFYGLYTWLTHMIFGIQIVFIPSALAATFGAIPFLGAYWAALPAVLELWLVHGQGVKAILLMVCHLLPSSVVDTAIYSEIKGGHPYLTGLSIAGGMYWLGLEGAIIGPILLCCLIVAVNVYSTMLKPESAISTTGKGGSIHGASTADKKVSFNLKRAFSEDSPRGLHNSDVF